MARRGLTRRRWFWPTVAGVLLVVVGVGWLGYRVLNVKHELEAGLAVVSQVQNGADPAAALRTLAAHTSKAADATADPVWRVGEFVPLLGDNLRGVRLAAESASVLSADLAIPALDAFGSSGEGAPLGRLIPIMKAVAPRVVELNSELAAVNQSGWMLEPVRDGVGQVAEVMDTAAPLVDRMPALLGGDGPVNYLLVAQNNAEWVGLGGSAASQTLIRIDNGDLTIGKQTDSGDYQHKMVEVPEVDYFSALALYNPVMAAEINASVSRPDFPTAAQLIRAFWQRDINDDKIDGVISIDPLALSRVLTATGPIKSVLGKEVNANNVVKLLLKDVYAMSADPEVGDDFFKAVATAVFEKVADGKFELSKMLDAVLKGADQGNVFFWSADPQVQALVAKAPIGGVLPTTNDGATTLGVYFRDASAGTKIDYYMKSSVLAMASCSAAGETEFTVSVKLNLDISQAEADALPDYVQSQVWRSEKYDTEVYIYGPPGTGVMNMEPGAGAARLKDPVVDLGRPVAPFTTTMKPGGTVVVEAKFIGTDGQYPPLDVRTTPAVRTPSVTYSGKPCGS